MSIDTPTPIDFRSDTVTRPTPQMRQAMADAEVGDDVFGDDPSVHRLEARAAALLGKEAGLFVASGTMSNLCAILSHCERGDEYIVGQQAHTYRYEGGGAAVLGSVQPQPLENADDGTIPVDAIAAAIKPPDLVFARTRLVCLENTIGGQAIPTGYVEEVEALVRQHGLGFHLDGARLFNASVALEVGVDALAAAFDTVSICLSKGLGAPVGSVLVGPKALIEGARRWRKVLGGGWRQAGVLAAAGLLALDRPERWIAGDHARARRLAEGLREAGWQVVGEARTNHVFVRLSDEAQRDLAGFLAERGVTVATRGPVLRLVTHRDLSDDDIERAIAAFAEFTAWRR